MANEVPENNEEEAKKRSRNHYRPIDERLHQARLAIDGAGSDGEILTVLSEFGYDETKLREGRALLDEATEAVNAHKVRYGEKDESSKDLTVAADQADQEYKKTLAVARVALKKDTKAVSVLYLTGPREQTNAGWLAMIDSFYTNLLANPGWVAKMEAYKFGRAKLEAGQRLVEAVKNLEVKQTQKKGDAQQSTIERDAKLEKLAEWMSDFKEIAFAAFDEKPQLLEKLGFVV